MKVCDFYSDKEDFGKKGNVLRSLNFILSKEENVYVPETLIIPTSVFDSIIKNRLLNNQKLLTENEKQYILGIIRKKFKNKKLVIRSSASCEDSILFTSSGQYDSFLNLTKDKDIISAIEKIYSSFLSENAKMYYTLNNIDYNKNSMAVLIQEVSPVKFAGVMFTSNPVNGKAKPIIEFCNGLGENVVSGQKAVTTIMGNYDKLENKYKKLIKIGEIISSSFEKPQDIEWGMDENENIYIFQSRPIVLHARNMTKFLKINSKCNKFLGETISYGFTIGKINYDNNFNNNIIVQTGKLTAKDLRALIYSKGVILTTGGFLSHFANIIREFNKPAILFDDTNLLDGLYVVDAYNGWICKFNDLSEKDKNNAIWNMICDVVINGDLNYKKSLGIKSYAIENDLKFNKQLNIITQGLKMIMLLKNYKMTIEFDCINKRKDFIEIFCGGILNV